MYVCGYTCMYVHVFMCTCVRVCSVTCCSISDPFGEIQTRCRRSESDSNLYRYGPIHWRFEDRSMGWSVDQCQFMPWRPDEIRFRNLVISCECLTSLIKFYLVMLWVFVIMYLPFLVCITCWSYHFMWLSLIFYQFDYLHLFMKHLWLSTLFM